MTIEHIAMYVSELESMRSFYETYFRARSNALYSNPRTGLKTYFLSFEDGCRLEIMARPDVPIDEKPLLRSGYIHMSLGVQDRAEVDSLTKRLQEDGFEVTSRPRVTGDGYYESCVLDPEGNQVEIVSR